MKLYVNVKQLKNRRNRIEPVLIELPQNPQKIRELCIKGSRHQRLVALYYLYATEIPYSRHLVAKDVVRNFHEEQDVMAIAMRSFMGDVSNYLCDIVFVRDDAQSYIYAGRREKNPDPKAEISKYFKDRKECLEFYELLQKMYDQLPKKGVELSPCVFPWNKESLTRSDREVITMTECVFWSFCLPDRRQRTSGRHWRQRWQMRRHPQEAGRLSLSVNAIFRSIAILFWRIC